MPIPCYLAMLDETQIGTIGVLVDADGIVVRITRADDLETLHATLANEEAFAAASGAPTAKAKASLKKAVHQLEAYIAGTRKELDLPHRFVWGTVMQQAIWEAMRKVRHGTIRSYGEIAADVGSPKASRAVGAACGRNPLFLIVPCHRIVSASAVGGYGGWSNELKRWLLKREGIDAARRHGSKPTA